MCIGNRMLIMLLLMLMVKCVVKLQTHLRKALLKHYKNFLNCKENHRLKNN